MKIKTSIFLVAMLTTPALFAADIQTDDPAKPIKISENTNYFCSKDGKGLVKKNNGDYKPLKNVTCHDDYLWLNGKALGVMDMLSYAAVETIQNKASSQH
ncbi:hypothetical protein [Pantoea sp. BAV 3049]|uniref:hypothetical protein n=1 Tax=Pantoea sp. BAV 3049 TaxID=2654188 RepID=UPI00131D0502|nr:hypothetical protein [Pantoea sp. BAV 3049]